MAESSLGKMRIAVVDDEKMLLNVFSSLLKHSRYRADFFSNPQKAMTAITDNPSRYDLLISDVRMPGMNGLEFAKRVRFLVPKIPIIFMAWDLSEELKNEVAALGNTLCLEKPFPLEETLKETIPKFLTHQRPQFP